jgi:anti-repressor protein
MTDILVGHLSKKLKAQGVDIGRNKLFKWLRENRYIEDGGACHNRPFDGHIKSGLMSVDVAEGGMFGTSYTPLITPKGLEHFLEVFTHGR